MNYIPVSLENQANLHAGHSEVTNNVGTPQASNASTSEEEEEDEELLIVSTPVHHVSDTQKPSTNSMEEELPDTTTLTVNTGGEPVKAGKLPPTPNANPDDSDMPELEIFHKPDTGIFDEASYDTEGVVYDFDSLPSEIEVSPTPTLRIHTVHPKSQILGDPKSAMQTRSREEPKTISEALKDESWIEAMQEELL
ncbi:hypothetical protein Tco_0125845 [Tanacetum coccineum]